MKSAFGLVTSTPRGQGRRGQDKLSESSPHGSGGALYPRPQPPPKRSGSWLIEFMFQGKDSDSGV